MGGEQGLVAMHQKFKLMSSEIKRENSQKVLKKIKQLQKQQRLGPNFWLSQYNNTSFQTF